MTDIKKEDLPEIKSIKIKMFIREYTLDFNATKAAKRAGYTGRSIRQMASKLLKQDDISLHIQYLIQERNRKLDIKTEDVLRELKGVGFSRMTDFVEFGDKDKADALNEEDFDSYEEYIQEKELLSMAFKVKTPEQMGDSLAAIDELSIGGNGVLNIKIRGKIKALELIGKHIGMWSHKAENSEEDREASLCRIKKAIKITAERRINRENKEREYSPSPA